MSAPGGSLTRMRPALRLGLLPLWRDRDTVQIGIDPRRAVAISGMATAFEVIRLLDGSRQREQIVAEASARGVPEVVSERVLTLLAAAGVLIDFPAGPLRSVRPELRHQLLPLLATASLCALDGDGGGRLLARRKATTVEVRGSGPVAATLTDLLGRSGVTTTGGASSGERRPVFPDLVVLVGHQSPTQTTELLSMQGPYLAVCAEEAIGVVGPLVLPGLTACLRCLDLARTDGDPAWPLILAQRAQRLVDPPACDAVLATSVAAQAAAQVLAFADRPAASRVDPGRSGANRLGATGSGASQLGTSGSDGDQFGSSRSAASELAGDWGGMAIATANGTLELVLPSWQWRRRSWRPHPACLCGCRAAA
jgi:hypothetical protein